MGYRTLPRYLAIEFRIRRVVVQPRLQTEDAIKPHLREEVQRLRTDGDSYPTIAHKLNISVGTAWNLGQQA
jgi:DNA-binding NarL/FixJ family response regulator